MTIPYAILSRRQCLPCSKGYFLVRNDIAHDGLRGQRYEIIGGQCFETTSFFGKKEMIVKEVK